MPLISHPPALILQWRWMVESVCGVMGEVVSVARQYQTSKLDGAPPGIVSTCPTKAVGLHIVHMIELFGAASVNVQLDPAASVACLYGRCLMPLSLSAHALQAHVATDPSGLYVAGIAPNSPGYVIEFPL